MAKQQSVAQSLTREAEPARTRTPASTRSRPYRRARQDRGAETRAQLVEAALDVFGRFGFEGATTREIAKAAGANLAAIAYHFGSKEALHIAVAEHVAARLRADLEPTLAEIASPAAVATRDTAASSFAKLLETYIDIIVGSAEAERWARFIVREQMQPSAAFETIYAFMSGPVGLATRLVAVATGRPQDEETGIRVFALFGQVLIFRVAQAMITRHTGWATIGERERGEIKRVVAGHVATILTGETPS